jgi:hypothetical protein
MPVSPLAAAATHTDCTHFLLGFRVSAFLRASGFGLRTLTSSLWLLAPVLTLPASDPTAPDDIPPLRPPHAEIPPTFWEQHSVLVVVLAALLLALACVAVWFLTRPKPPMIVPPDVQARQALEPLRQQTEDGALLSRVSQILRHYVAAVFDLPPGELTTAEFCRAITGRPQIGPDLSAALCDFLRLCDRDKFSPPALVPPLNAVAQTLKLIDQSQARRLANAQSAAQPAQSAVPIASRTGAEQ